MIVPNHDWQLWGIQNKIPFTNLDLLKVTDWRDTYGCLTPAPQASSGMKPLDLQPLYKLPGFCLSLHLKHANY